MLTFEALSKSFPGRRDPAVDRLDLQVRDGEILGLVGLNGAGKTTAIRVAAGVAFPSAGTVRVDGHDIVRAKVEAAGTLGWVPEFPNFEPVARALPLLQYLAGYHGLGGEEARDRCEGLLRQMGLEGFAQERVGTFSQGMKKRFALAAALLARPKNLLLDELLNGLDPEGIRSSRNILLALRHQGAAILLSSHILAEIEQVADRIAFVHRGRLLRTIDREALEKAPGRRLRVRLTSPDAAALAYLGTVGKAASEGRSFVVEEPTLPPEAINAELHRRGYAVIDLHMETEDLESYFFRLIEGAG